MAAELRARGGCDVLSTLTFDLRRQGWPKADIDHAIEDLAADGALHAMGIPGDVTVWLTAAAIEAARRGGRP